MVQCALCGDERRNIRWYVNEKPVCKRHYDKVGRIADIFQIKVKLKEVLKLKEEGA
jgi:hypothetical protein